MDDFEKELQEALQRRPAPPSLKRRMLEQRGRRLIMRRHSQVLLWQRLAASLALAAVLGAGADWGIRRLQDRRKGEEARRQVLIALRITGYALNQVNTRLASRDRGTGE